MAIGVGDKLPAAELLRIGADGPETVAMPDYVAGRKVVIFALPGAYTGTCTTSHVPSFMRVIDDLKDKGVDEVICVSVNDPFVMEAWGASTGAAKAGITFLADASGTFTKGMDRVLDAPAVGLHGRSLRYAMVVEDGVVTLINDDENPGVCDVSGGEAVLAAL
ncbi:MAG: peroxiredoxin [Pseudomonadota bacterium]